MILLLAFLPFVVLSTRATFQGCFTGIQGSEPTPPAPDESSCITSCIADGAQYAGHHPVTLGPIECICANATSLSNLSDCASPTIAPWKVYLLNKPWHFFGCYEQNEISDFVPNGTAHTPKEAMTTCFEAHGLSIILLRQLNNATGSLELAYQCRSSRPVLGIPRACNTGRFYVYED